MLNIFISIDRSKPRIYTYLLLCKKYDMILRCRELNIESLKDYIINTTEVYNQPCFSIK